MHNVYVFVPISLHCKATNIYGPHTSVTTWSSANSRAYDTKIFYATYTLAVYQKHQANVLISVTTLLVIVEVMMYFNAEHANESCPQMESARVPKLITNKFNGPVTCLSPFLTLAAP